MLTYDLTSETCIPLQITQFLASHQSHILIMAVLKLHEKEQRRDEVLWPFTEKGREKLIYELHVLSYKHTRCNNLIHGIAARVAGVLRRANSCTQAHSGMFQLAFM
jgi:hypothetical protein